MTLALLEAGHSLVVADQSADALEALVGNHADVGDRLRVCEVDLFTREGCDLLLDFVARHVGVLDVLVNNAGIGPPAIRGRRPDPYRFWEVSPKMFDRFFALNSTAPYYLAARLVRGMRDRCWGRIVNVTTSLDTMLRMSVYGGSKAALEAHTACMAVDLEGSGVTANVLIPGGMTRSGMTVFSNLPEDQMFGPEIMEAPIVWLASDQSDGVSGRRYLAWRWDRSLPDEAAEQAAGAPVAWTGFGMQGKNPATFDVRWKRA